MGISARRLAADEHVVASTRTHPKALVLPALVLILTCAVTGFLLAAALSKVGPLLGWVVVAIAAVVVSRYSVGPFLRWLSASYTVTTRRLILNSGVLRRSRRDVPLQMVINVEVERGLLDRLLGSGTLVVSDAGDVGRAVLCDVPRVSDLQRTIDDLLYDRSSSPPDRSSQRLTRSEW